MSNKKVLKATFIVMAMTILSRFLGFFRDILAGYHFGAGKTYDVYSAAVSIPESVFMIIGLAISTTFIPMLSEVKHKKGKEEMFKFSNNVVTILGVISVIALSLGLIYTEEVVKVFVTNFPPEKMAETVFLTRISLFNIIFLCINACFASILQVCEDFVIPSILGLFFNLPIIIYLILFKDVSILGLTIANVIGNIFRVVVQIPSLYKQGYVFRPSINLKDERLKRLVILIIPVIIGAGANSLNMIVDKNLASGLGDGAISALDFAQKLIIFANTAITTSIVSVMYPLMANRLNSGDKKGFLEYLSKSIVTISVFLIPIMMAFILLGRDVVTFIYERGKFDETAVTITTLAFIGYAVQLPFAGVRDILNSSLFSMQKTKLTTINGVIGVFVNIALSIFLSKKIGIMGIAISTSISAIVTSVLLFNTTRNLIGDFDVKSMLIKLLKIAIASTIMVVGIYFVNNIFTLNNIIIKLLIDFVIGVVL
ncbi:murein biosynthesis integral membrane protein MurJ, partial [Clostridium sp.]|uniref:murein biosynthesis integral membrane protein MurJ n=1 Tax=Clostridium sp. TaxID=1506 RepID=UPI003F371FFA